MGSSPAGGAFSYNLWVEGILSMGNKHIKLIYSNQFLLPPTAFLLLQFLAVFVDENNVLNIPTRKFFAVLPISKSSLWRGLKILENKGLITYKRTNTHLMVQWLFLPKRKVFYKPYVFLFLMVKFSNNLIELFMEYKTN